MLFAKVLLQLHTLIGLEFQRLLTLLGGESLGHKCLAESSLTRVCRRRGFNLPLRSLGAELPLLQGPLSELLSILLILKALSTGAIQITLLQILILAHLELERILLVKALQLLVLIAKS